MSSFSDQTHNQKSDHQQKQKRFIEKFKTKLVELFFMTNRKASTQNDMNMTRQVNNRSNYSAASSTINFKENSISNYYYGYITMNLANDYNKKSIKRNKKISPLKLNATDNNSCHSIESSSKSSNVCEHDIESVCSYQVEKNPFLNASLCELLSFANLVNFNKIKSHFEPFMHTIEDENNFFDTNFMTNYISFYLMNNLSKSFFLSENNLNLVTNETYNQVKQIAREIFIQSECEPCGLKGCAIRVFFESETDDLTQLLCNFKFDSNSYLTTFQLDLTIVCQFPSHIKTKMQCSNETNQSDNTLAKSLKSLISFKNTSWDKYQRMSSIMLRNQYCIKKIKLY